MGKKGIKYGKQLIRIGKRKCYLCKKILNLSSQNFIRNKSAAGKFDWICKPCHIIKNREYRIKNGGKELKLRFQLLKEHNFTCNYCGRSSPKVILEIDHIIPKSKNGINKKSNYTVACKDCNIGKGDILLI